MARDVLWSFHAILWITVWGVSMWIWATWCQTLVVHQRQMQLPKQKFTPLVDFDMRWVQSQELTRALSPPPHSKPWKFASIARLHISIPSFQGSEAQHWYTWKDFLASPVLISSLSGEHDACFVFPLHFILLHFPTIPQPARLQNILHGYLRSVSSAPHPASPPSQRSAFGTAVLMEKAVGPSPTLGSLHKGACVRGAGGT